MSNILRVLQIEDSESDAELILRLLERAGYDVQAQRVEDAAAIRAALARATWDLIVADYSLPEIDAPAALKLLQETGLDIPFIVVSGAIGEDVAVAMMKSGAHDYLLKDNLARLAPAVTRELREARARRARSRAEAALHESERRFRQLAESIPQLVWIVCSNRKILYCNSRCQEQLTLGPGQSICPEPLHPDDRDLSLAAWDESVETETEYRLECRYRMAGGEYRWFLVRALPVRDHKGHVTQWFGTSTEIQEQKENQERLVRANLELARSNTMLEQFAYIASHDLQEPLRGVINFVELLELRYKGRLDETADKYIRFISDSARRMKSLIDGLLTLSRAGRRDADLLPVHVDDVLDQALENLTARLEETRAVVTRRSLPAIMADARQLTQLFQNLIGNALKYHKEGTIPLVEISAEQRGQDWVFAVRDNGIGIDPGYAKRIFQVFKRLHRNDRYGGTGIGLAVCQKIVERHQGRIWVESAVGAGATFYFTLPNVAVAQDGELAQSASAVFHSASLSVK